MPNSLYEIRLQGIVVVLFIKTNIHSKMVTTSTMIPCSRISQRELGIRFGVNFVFQYLSSRIIIGFDLKQEVTLLLSVTVVAAFVMLCCQAFILFTVSFNISTIKTKFVNDKIEIKLAFYTMFVTNVYKERPQM